LTLGENTYWLNESATHFHKLRLFQIVFFTNLNSELFENILNVNVINEINVYKCNVINVLFIAGIGNPELLEDQFLEN
jgi:hypothetical protein